MENENEIESTSYYIMYYWALLNKFKWRIVAVVTVVTVISVFISLSLPKVYTAEVILMPLGGAKGMGGGVAMIASQMGLGGLLGGGGSSSGSIKLLVMMQSRTMAERMVRKYDLIKILYPTLWDQEKQRWRVAAEKLPDLEQAALDLLTRISFAEDRQTQLVHVTGKTSDPNLSARLANAYVEEFGIFLNETTLTASKKNRIFIGEQLEANRTRLLESGKDLSDFYRTNRISNVNPTVDVAVTVPKSLSGDLDKESPDMVSEQQKSDFMEHDLDRLQLPGIADAFAEVQKKQVILKEKIEEVGGEIQKTAMVKAVPQQVYLQYLTLQRELLGQLNALLSQQYEMAKIEESKEEVSFQVIDWARVPKQPSGPRKRKIVAGAFFASLGLSILGIFIKDFIQKVLVQESTQVGQ